MAVAAVVAFSISPLSASPGSGAAVPTSPVRVTAAVAPESSAVSERDNAVGTNPGTAPSRARSETCRSAKNGTRWYRQRQRDWLKLRGVKPTPVGRQAPRKPRSCPDARFLAKLWRSRSFAARQATERWQERLRWDVSLAINYVFGPYAGQAHRVVSCESGHSTTASNGQYLGLFQMGSSERRLYGHGDTPLEQARAAHRYFVASGRDWSPWSCQP